ncbi:MAG: MFS transporter [Bacteroidales bacterium]|nr:MFS transporter [Bacteroidales bacterium]
MASLKEKIGYALGDAASGGITWKIMSIAFPLYFTNVFGLSLADAAVLMLVARLFDVVTDPLMGSLSDRTQSKFGTYRPWLIFGAIPFGLIFALLLYTPDFDATGKRIYAYTLYLVMMAMYTAVNVPYGSLLGVMTDDDNEKNQFSSFRMVGAYAMGFITLLSFPYIQGWIGGGEYSELNNKLVELKAIENPSDDIKNQIQSISQSLVPMLQHQYAVIGVTFGIIAAVMTLACGLLTKERLKPVRAEKFSFKQFADLVKNKPWIYLTSIGICTNFFNGFRYAVAGYMFTYCLNGDVTLGSFIINYTVFMAFGEVICMIFGGVSPVFTKKIGSKKMAFFYASIICLVFSVLFFLIPMDKSYMWLMIVFVILTSVGVGLYSPLLWSMYADVADYATEKNGTSSTGLIFSSGTMAQKLGGAVSGSLIALLLGVAGATMIEDAMGNLTIDAVSVTDSVKTMIWSLFSLFPALFAGIMAILAYKFPLKK